MKMLLGAILGGVVAWLYASGRGRQQARQRLAAAPDALQHVRQSVAAAAADGAQRVSQAIDAAPLPAQVKAPASGAAYNVWAAADTLGQPRSQSGPAEGAEAEPAP